MFDVSGRIRELREQHGMSMTKLAKIAGVGQSTLSYIENGKQSPTVDILERICSAFGISLAEFFSSTADNESKNPLVKQLEVYADKLSEKELGYLCRFLEEITKVRKE